MKTKPLYIVLLLTVAVPTQAQDTLYDTETPSTAGESTDYVEPAELSDLGAYEPQDNQERAEPAQPHGWDMMGRLDKLERESNAAGAAAPESGVQGTSRAGTYPYYAKALYGAFITFALLALFVYVMHRIRRRSPLLAGGGLAKVVGRFHLNPRASLHFVRVGDRVLILGITRENISLVSEMDAAAFDEAREETEDQTQPEKRPVDFLAHLRDNVRSINRDETDATDVQDELDSLRGEIRRLQRNLRDESREVD
ncbi:MAG TPA: FliO/MopB family protein [Candidatus Hydrogenedentes bacterium]|nr:FliO/MopB family protein [Candidatus Hydrogenedentota bacterium]HIJ73889.1 FliO/MopB family protein [Candidatus Hydrogenedentota bacterium]